MWACEHGHLDVAMMLMRKYKINPYETDAVSKSS